MAVVVRPEPHPSPALPFATAGQRTLAAVAVSAPFACLVGATMALAVGATAGLLTAVLVGVPLAVYVRRFLAAEAPAATPADESPAARACAVCGGPFAPARANQRYCGADCRRAAAARRRAAGR